MTLQVSTEFKTQLLAGFPAIFNGGVIAVYNGTQPVTADDAVTGSLLGYVTLNGGYWAPGDTNNGLLYDANGPYVSMPFGAQWALTVRQNGTASWFRVLGKDADVGGTSYDMPRIDGSINTSAETGAQLILPDVTLVLGDTIPINYFMYTIPPVLGS